MAIVADRGRDPRVDQSLDNDRFTITPSDTVKLPAPIDGIIVGTGGVVRFKNPDGSTIDITFVAGGPYFVGQPTHVYSTGTTALELVGVVSKALR
uniref:Uncharacterized protein n=1 Tax=viral metagenome TaxID=1070528 RepID=A0A6H1Z9M4_9ZZZZ